MNRLASVAIIESICCQINKSPNILEKQYNTFPVNWFNH